MIFFKYGGFYQICSTWNIFACQKQLNNPKRQESCLVFLYPSKDLSLIVPRGTIRRVTKTGQVQELRLRSFYLKKEW